jgi:hypothetical protein
MISLSNILKKASTIIPTEPFEYRVLQSHSTNAIGNITPNYTEWKPANGQVQPGLTFSFNARGVSNPGEIAKQLGIDMSKEIITVYAPDLNLRNVHDQDQPDQIRYHGKVYNIWSISNWFEYNGWKSLICVEDTRERTKV